MCGHCLSNGGNYCADIHHCSCGVRNLLERVCGNYPAVLSQPFEPAVLFHWFPRAEVQPWAHMLTSHDLILSSGHYNTTLMQNIRPKHPLGVFAINHFACCILRANITPDLFLKTFRLQVRNNSMHQSQIAQ